MMQERRGVSIKHDVRPPEGSFIVIGLSHSPLGLLLSSRRTVTGRAARLSTIDCSIRLALAAQWLRQLFIITAQSKLIVLAPCERKDGRLIVKTLYRKKPSKQGRHCGLANSGIFIGEPNKQ